MDSIIFVKHFRQTMLTVFYMTNNKLC